VHNQTVGPINTGPSPVPGCTDPSASNYDPLANQDDGSCVYAGCTDPTATNYNPSANLDDGSCTYCTSGVINGGAGAGIGFDSNIITSGQSALISNSNELHVATADAAILSVDCTISNQYLPPGTTITSIGSSVGANTPIYLSNTFNNAPSQQTNTILSITYECGCDTDIDGCTDPTASNYNPNATNDDGSCIYSVDCSSISINFYTVLTQGSYPNIQLQTAPSADDAPYFFEIVGPGGYVPILSPAHGPNPNSIGDQPAYFSGTFLNPMPPGDYTITCTTSSGCVDTSIVTISGT